MTPDLLALVRQYRTGIEAVLSLLRRLEALVDRQREASERGDLDALARIGDERDALTANIVTLEHQMRPMRLALLQRRGDLHGSAEFGALAALHKAAAALVTSIVESDEESLAALNEAELARRVAVRAVEQGETTLAAYRRILAPPLTGANIVDRKG